MGAPTAPTKTTICTEALRRFSNGATPPTADITRATDFGLEKVKRDLMNLGKRWKPLLKTDYIITIAGDADYANPDDFEAYKTVKLLSGVHSGALSNVGSASIVTLAADEDATKLQVDGKLLLLTSGTGVNQAKQVASYVFATKVATMAEAYSTLPVIPVGYLVVNATKDLIYFPKGYFDQFSTRWTPGTPVRYTVTENATVGALTVHPVPNAVMGIERTYYADLMKLDITEGSTTLYTTILTRWAGLFEQGVYVWKLGEDDDRYEAELQAYQSMLVAAAVDDLVGYVAPQGGK